MSVCFTFESQRDYPGTEFGIAVSRLGKKIQVYALHCKTWEMVISPRRFAENGKEMYRNKKSTWCACQTVNAPKLKNLRLRKEPIFIVQKGNNHSWYCRKAFIIPASAERIYYINTSEIPSELSRENFIPSHVKTCYLHTWRDHRRYGYIINRAFESKLIWYFTGVYIINRILHTRLCI